MKFKTPEEKEKGVKTVADYGSLAFLIGTFVSLFFNSWQVMGVCIVFFIICLNMANTIYLKGEMNRPQIDMSSMLESLIPKKEENEEAK